MEKLRTLTSQLDDIDRTCEQIIRKAVPVMKSLVSNRSDLIGQLIIQHGVSEENVKESLQLASLKLVEDARTVKKELPEFIDSLLNNQSLDGSPFLAEVWSGDAYGSQGQEALNELHDELKAQLENCSLSYLISNLKF